MLVKTKEFEKKLNSKLYQYSFNKKIPLSLKGSFYYATYISDIDFTAYVHFNEKFIQILIHKINRSKDFKFIYLNAGTDINFKTPWVIYPEWGCDFDIIKAKQWFVEFKSKNLIPPKSYNEIVKILNKKKLLLGDLIDIQEILDQYNTIKWFLPDIINGTKTVNNHKYVLLDELRKDTGPVLNSIYIDGNNIVSVDIGLTDKKYKHPIWSRMYKYYTENWYKILKSYKKLISKDYSKEYYKTLKIFEYDNALLAQVELLNSLMKYKVVPQTSVNYIAQNLHKNLDKIGITSRDLKHISEILSKRLNTAAKPYVNYFMDKLTHVSKIKTYKRIRLTEVSQIGTTDKILMQRRKDGILCPFFESDVEEYIKTLATKLLLNNKKFRECLIQLSKQDNKPFDKFVKDIFYNSPISRLFLQSEDSKNKIYVRGALINDDDILFYKIGQKGSGYYIFDQKYRKRLQIYLVTGY